MKSISVEAMVTDINESSDDLTLFRWTDDDEDGIAHVRVTAKTIDDTEGKVREITLHLRVDALAKAMRVIEASTY